MIPRDTCLTRYARLDMLLGDAGTGDWLGGEELREFDRIRNTARQQQWLAGRLLSRELLAEAFSLDSDQKLQILSRDDRNLGVSPRVLIEGRELNCGLSIAHSQRGVLVAVSAARSLAIGVDLCEGLVATPGFLRLWFTAAEQNWIQADSSRAATVWAIKEAVYKALSQGAAWNPREVEVLPAAESSFACRYQGRKVPLTLNVFELDRHVAAIASAARSVCQPLDVTPGSGLAALCDSLDFHPVCGSSHD